MATAGAGKAKAFSRIPATVASDRAGRMGVVDAMTVPWRRTTGITSKPGLMRFGNRRDNWYFKADPEQWF
ncbi:hypothetical protein GCM10023174_04430 [Chelativorans composti]